MFYELMPKFNNQKSFYNKAIIEESKNEKKLYSYGTLVAIYSNGNLEISSNYNYLTNTTLKHVKDFMFQLGMKPLKKWDLYKTYKTEKF